MPRPTLDDIFTEPDEFGLLEVAPQKQVASKSDGGAAVLSDVTRFFEQHGRLPDPDAEDHEAHDESGHLAGAAERCRVGWGVVR